MGGDGNVFVDVIYYVIRLMKVYSARLFLDHLFKKWTEVKRIISYTGISLIYCVTGTLLLMLLSHTLGY